MDGRGVATRRKANKRKKTTTVEFIYNRHYYESGLLQDIWNSKKFILNSKKMEEKNWNSKKKFIWNSKKWGKKLEFVDFSLIGPVSNPFTN